jgi:lipopolysaccharide/colanic/teichoic acid biosynthesis glycosyltransferase/glycosyltransferase involved in cell wall biosynthesis
MRNLTLGDIPFVSIIVPCFNEANFIAMCLDSIISGNYPHDRMEILVIDGMSTDGTRKILSDYARRYPFVRIIDNPRQATPVALNLGILVARGELVAWMSAHNRYAPNYLSLSVAYLREYDADSVGGILITVPRQPTLVGRAIVQALSHPFGVGNSYTKIHVKKPRWLDAVFGGCYRRDVFDRVGLFNEELVRSQDIEFHSRLRRANGRILLVPEIVSYYYAKSDLKSFFQQNWVNGEWAILPFLYSQGMPVAWRHLVPLAAVLAAMGLGGAQVGWHTGAWLLALLAAAYCGLNVGASLQVAARQRDARYVFAMPVVFAALHVGYGLGSFWGVVQVARSRILGLRSLRRDRPHRERSAGMPKSVGKRLLDILVSSAVLVVLSPVFALVAALIKIDSSGPVFYRGTRVGLNGHLFQMYKFRTMVAAAETIGGPHTPSDDPRITRMGRWIRRFNLDELPQFWNVLRGDMSIVGPRPEVPQYVPLFSEDEKAIFSVRPGITDWATLWVRNEGKILEGSADPERTYMERIWPEKHRLQLEYVRKSSVWVDIMIMVQTLKVHLFDRFLSKA